MNNQPSNESESLWRGRLSEADRARLGARPDLELEARLSEALIQIPEAPVPSNFSARVMQAIDLEESRNRRAVRRWNWRAWLPRTAVAAAILAVAGIGLQQYEIRSQHRAEMVKNVALIAATQPPPSVDVLENLDVIQRMGESGHADRDLLAALQ